MKKVEVSLTLVALLCALHVSQIAGAISNQDIREVAELDDQAHYENALSNILVPRVVGSIGWKSVQNFIVRELKAMGMQVEVDSFNDYAPLFGKLNFVNIIGKLNPTADRFLVLSAHYDSKYFSNMDFLGATDSAVPCALMLNLVKTSLPLLQKMLEGKNLGLMLIFFDGEEAFENWSATDSLYGSRHLARKWELEKYKNERQIDRISVLVLMDLIGSTNARFICTFRNTCALNKRLREIEDTLKTSSSLRAVPNGPASMFVNTFKTAGVEDDHIPFLQRSVPILHLIPTSFPSVWHTQYDDGQRVDHQAVLNFNKVMRAFIIDYVSTCANNPKASRCRFK